MKYELLFDHFGLTINRTPTEPLYKSWLKSCGVIAPWVIAQTYLQLPLRQWGASDVYLLVLSSWKVNIAENPIAVMGM